MQTRHKFLGTRFIRMRLFACHAPFPDPLTVWPPVAFAFVLALAFVLAMPIAGHAETGIEAVDSVRDPAEAGAQPHSGASSPASERESHVVFPARAIELHASMEREALEHDRRARLHELGAIARTPAAIDTLPDLTPEERRVVHRRHRTLNPLD